MGCLEPQPLSGSVIQSVFDHSQLLIGDSFHAPLLGNVLPQQSVEVLVAAALATASAAFAADGAAAPAQ